MTNTSGCNCEGTFAGSNSAISKTQTYKLVALETSETSMSGDVGGHCI